MRNPQFGRNSDRQSNVLGTEGRMRIALVCADQLSSKQFSLLLSQKGLKLNWIHVGSTQGLLQLPVADRVLFLDALANIHELSRARSIPRWLVEAPKALVSTQAISGTIAQDARRLRVSNFDLASIRRGSLAFQSWATARLRPATSKRVEPSLQGGFIPKSVSIIALGASTGGVEAIQRIMPAFSPATPPTLLVQHTKTENGSALAKLLDQFTKATVKAAQNNEPLKRGTVYLAGDRSRHLLLDRTSGLSAKLEAGSPVTGHRPSVDVCFDSVSELGRNALGILLTGMGEDGAKGLGTIKRRSGWTIAQDEATSLVYGMPRAAHAIGADCEQLSLDDISHRLRQLLAVHRTR